MEDFIREFGRISAESELRDLLMRFGLRLADARSHPDQNVLGVFTGKVDGVAVKIIHRLAGARINRLSLEIPGRESVDTSFSGDY